MAKSKSVNTKQPKKVVEKDEVFYEPEKKKGILYFIWTAIFWIAILFLFFVWIFDFMNVKANKAPKFCVKELTHVYEDGNVEECQGLGYKIYRYNRTSLDINREFRPFFAKIRK